MVIKSTLHVRKLIFMEIKRILESRSKEYHPIDILLLL